MGKQMSAQIAGFALLVLSAASQVSGQSVAAKLQETREFNSQSTTLRGQLIDFAQSYGIPMGLELVAGNERPVKPIRAQNDTAINVLRKIIQHQPGYDFDSSDGVVNVYSINLVNDYKNFLNLRLRRYEITDQNLFGAKYYLQLAISQTLHPSQSYGGGYGGMGLNNNLHVVKISFSGENLTVRQILNRLISIHDGALWIVQLNPAKTMKGDRFYTQTLAGTGVSGPEFYWEFVPLR
ncbi:MAG TPA: hypothetical protein VNO50_17305 [Pyrinomonadaceae bacterium]|nr:hypothetical protein [Pyrinomonadaceae bacterium]